MAAAAPKRRRTARWVIPVFGLLLASGVIVILSHYMFFAGRYQYLLFVGLGLIALSLIVATQIY